MDIELLQALEVGIYAPGFVWLNLNNAIDSEKRSKTIIRGRFQLL